ncbi:MAG: serine/threonine protein kinase [Planctomycetota bacterium]|nr:MAG: serine/threonine protein kinase [Planctomycetota bacterium]
MSIGNRELVFAKILLKNKLATFDEVSSCLKDLSKGRFPNLSFEEVCLKKGILTETQLEEALKAMERTLLLLEDIIYGKIAIQKGWVSEDQVQKCFAIQKASQYKISLGELLLLKDYISEDNHKLILEEIKKYQSQGGEFSLDYLKSKVKESHSFQNIKFGEMALKKLLVTSEQVQECLEIQKEMRKRGIEKKLGEVMMEKSYISDFHVKKIISAIQEGDSQLIENYIIEKKIGEGAMGVVYKAYLAGSKQPIALKVLRPHIAESRETLLRFAAEAKKAISLNHPNIVRAYEVGVSDEYYYYTMEYVEGENIRQMLEKQPFLPIPLAVKIVIDIASALEYASQFNIVHRDIKPDNIILQKDGKAKLCDLGIAKSLHEDHNLTQIGMVVGTPYYISPELAKGKKEIDIRSDLYSLGATFYKMITGKVPFDGDSATSVLLQHLSVEPIPPHEIRREIPPHISNGILKLMSKSPEHRFTTPRDLILYLKKAPLS